MGSPGAAWRRPGIGAAGTVRHNGDRFTTAC